MGMILINPFILQKHIPEHENLIQYYDSEVFDTDGTIQGVIITEHCEGGILTDVVTQTFPNSLSEKKILGILRDLLCGLYILHSSKPPISHRNINVFSICFVKLQTSPIISTFMQMVVVNWNVHDL